MIRKIGIYLIVGCVYLGGMDQALTVPECTHIEFTEQDKQQLISVLASAKGIEDDSTKMQRLISEEQHWQQLFMYSHTTGAILEVIHELYDKQIPIEFIALDLNTKGTREWLRERMAVDSTIRQALEGLLFVACYLRSPIAVDLASKLFAVGISPNFTNIISREFSGATPLITAVSRQDIALVQLFLDKGANIEGRSSYDGFTALMEAARDGSTDILRLLIKYKADVNATDYKGTTALIWAAKRGCLEAVKELVKAGANVKAQNEYGETALSTAKSPVVRRYNGKYEEIVKFLEDNGACE